MATLLKELYDKHYITLLASTLQSVENTFESQKFFNDVFIPAYDSYTLKERREHIAKVMARYLPNEFIMALEVLKKAFMAINTDKLYLQNMVFQEFVALYGVKTPQASLDALKTFTINSSSEFAIRVFLSVYEEQTLTKMLEFAKDSNEHIRRLASEGSRPRLPWAQKLESFIEAPTKTTPILELLKDDTSAYVRKSVANHLNDISKDNPAYTKELITRWYKENRDRKKMLRHAARTLLKNGDSEMMELFGYTQNKKIKLKDFVVDTEVQMGGELHLEGVVSSDVVLGEIRIEYEMEFVRKNGKTTTKIFHIFSGEVRAKEKKFTKSYSFKPITTRQYYTGEHRLSVVVNGVKIATKRFNLVQKVKDS